ncbi:hypothetical protein EIP91_002244 [Steccherinum ochraceum]|uniref:Uncharacterized protein n=1 Tax=Steccherinum ochraceum TaxID=92696 RepID=A0A4R0RCH9_9APHY|nr:hypothetical protein EIP91_002244 [Steccherinum ochraceum]
MRDLDTLIARNGYASLLLREIVDDLYARGLSRSNAIRRPNGSGRGSSSTPPSSGTSGGSTAPPAPAVIQAAPVGAGGSKFTEDLK